MPRGGNRGHRLAPLGQHYDHHHRDHGHKSSFSFGLFLGGGSWGFGLGYSNGHHPYYHGGSAIHLGFGGGPWYGASYLYGPGYVGYWDHVYWGYPRPVVYGGFYRHSRFHFGFNFYYPYAVYTPYPFYRTAYYEPWYVRSYGIACPTYRTYYYVNYDTPTYVESTDPYYEEDVEVAEYLDDWSGDAVVPISSLAADPLDEFSEPFADLPADLTYEEYLAWGEEYLYDGELPEAAEAFRRAMRMRTEDYFPKFQLALALMGLDEYRLSGLALQLGLDQNPAWVYRRFDLGDAFRDRAILDGAVKRLERHLIVNEADDAARFVLGYAYYFSGNLFGARGVFKVLTERVEPLPHSDHMARAAERRLIGDDR